MTNSRKNLVAICALGLAVAAGGCTWNRDDERTREERTRDEVAKATERAKPALEDAGRQIGKAAAEAASQAQAAAEGVREGWSRGKSHLVNVNAASESELVNLPGIAHRNARRIVDERPYRDKRELVAKGVISEEQYTRIRDRITTK